MKLSEEERWALVMDNKKLIHYALRIMGFSIKDPLYEDLFQECLLAEYKLTQWFDSEKSSWSTYSINYLNHQAPLIYSQLRNPIKLPRSLIITARDYNRDLDEGILSEDTEKHRIVWGSYMNLINILCLDCAAPGQDSELLLSDMIPSKFSLDDQLENDQVVEEKFYKALAKVEDKLPDTQALMLRDYIDSMVIFGKRLTQREIAIKYSKSQSYVSRVIKKGLKLLLKELKTSGFSQEFIDAYARRI